jgi:hypothetical protein
MIRVGVSIGVSKSGAEPAKRRVRRPRVQRRRAPKTTGQARNPRPPEKVQIARRRSGLVRCPRRSSAPQRAASGPVPVAPSAPDQRSACNGDRPLRSLPPEGRHLETFSLVHFGRSGTGALAPTCNGDRSLRSLPPVGRHLETFPHVHYGRSGTGALARRWLELTRVVTWIDFRLIF